MKTKCLVVCCRPGTVLLDETTLLWCFCESVHTQVIHCIYWTLQVQQMSTSVVILKLNVRFYIYGVVRIHTKYINIIQCQVSPLILCFSLFLMCWCVKTILGEDKNIWNIFLEALFQNSHSLPVDLYCEYLLQFKKGDSPLVVQITELSLLFLFK